MGQTRRPLRISGRSQWSGRMAVEPVKRIRVTGEEESALAEDGAQVERGDERKGGV